MNPWIMITLGIAGVVLGIDYLLRKKSWKANSKQEKISLLVNMLSGGPYAFLSVLGLLWGIVTNSPETAFGEILYDATFVLGGIYWIVALAAVIASLIFRKKGKIKESILVNVIAFAYITVVLIVNTLAGKIL